MNNRPKYRATTEGFRWHRSSPETVLPGLVVERPKPRALQLWVLGRNDLRADEELNQLRLGISVVLQTGRPVGLAQPGHGEGQRVERVAQRLRPVGAR